MGLPCSSNTASFTTVTTGMQIASSHITELQTAINNERMRRLQATASFTNISSSTTIKAQDILELYNAIQSTYPIAFINNYNNLWSTPIKASQITELQNKINIINKLCPSYCACNTECNCQGQCSQCNSNCMCQTANANCTADCGGNCNAN